MLDGLSAEGTAFAEALEKLDAHSRMDYIDLLQWPAMIVTITAAWLVASRSRQRRVIGFWVFLCSNALWAVWGWHASAYALIILQVSLALMNARGVYRNDPELRITTGKEPAG